VPRFAAAPLLIIVTSLIFRQQLPLRSKHHQAWRPLTMVKLGRLTSLFSATLGLVGKGEKEVEIPPLNFTGW